jgi:hypothetical protein
MVSRAAFRRSSARFPISRGKGPGVVRDKGLCATWGSYVCKVRLAVGQVKSWVAAPLIPVRGIASMPTCQVMTVSCKGLR